MEMSVNPITAQKLASSLTAYGKTVLIPFLPYLLQDLWELGTPPQEIVELLEKHRLSLKNRHFLDLACGKGAGSVALAKALQGRVKGVDIMPEFINAAKDKAAEHKVSFLYDFVVMDIKKALLTERGYDAVIFGAAGDILGSPEQTLQLLKASIKPEGLIILEDACLSNTAVDIKYNNYEYLSLNEWHEVFEGAGLKLLETLEASPDASAEKNNNDIEMISRRAAELSNLYPLRKSLLEDYVASQMAEVGDLENSVAIWVLQK